MALAARQRFYFDTVNPVALRKGTWHSTCSEADIFAYTKPVLTPLSQPFNSKAEGTRELTNFLNYQWPDDTVTDALNHHNMDVAFFNCVLRSRILVSWEDSVSMQFARFPDPDFANRLGSAQFDRVNNNCYIRLNRSNVYMTVDERQARGVGGSVPESVTMTDSPVRLQTQAKEFSASPPDILSKAQKERWNGLLMGKLPGFLVVNGYCVSRLQQLADKIELLDMNEKTAEQRVADDQEDPYKTRPRGELCKLKQLADLAGGKQE